MEEGLNASLLKQLECPVCFESCTPPIYMCRNGHNLCAKCRDLVRECVTCRALGQPNIRNLFAEHMSTQVRLPCPNQDEGCGECLTSAEMGLHLSTCREQFSYECRLPGALKAPVPGEQKAARRLTFKNKVAPLKKGLSDPQIPLSRTESFREKEAHPPRPPPSWCGWRGNRSALEEHVLSSHPGCFTREDSLELSCSLLTSTGRVEDNTKLYLTDGQYFWCVLHYHRERALMQGHATYIGGSKAASRFRFELRLCSENGESSLCFVSGVRILEDPFHVVNAKRCLSINEDTIRQFSVNSEVKCRMKIVKTITSDG